ncbi:hypothetical protein KI387_008905, partial [Taxus chinensis]
MQDLIAPGEKPTKYISGYTHDSLPPPWDRVAEVIMLVEDGKPLELMQYLVSIPGVKVNAINKKGLTGLDISAAQNQKPNSARIVEILQDAGATE